MKLNKAEDDLENLYFEKSTSNSGEVNMAVHPVLFGWRVRGWTKSSGFVEVDWCAGAAQQDIERLYSILYNILSHKEDDITALQDLPGSSKIKPYFNDNEFVVDLVKRLTPPFDIIHLSDLEELKATLKEKAYNVYRDKSGGQQPEET